MSADSLLTWPSSPKISLVIPVYNEEGSLPELHEHIKQALSGETYEVIFVDDGSSDSSFNILSALQKGDSHIKIVRFGRNFGKSAALAAGFRETAGEIIVTLDADLQEDPVEIPRFIAKIEKDGYDLVAGWRVQRNDPFSKTIPSKVWNTVANLLTGVTLHDVNCGFKAYKRRLISHIYLYGELHRFIPALAHWKGFRITEIDVHHQPRMHGKSKFGARRFWSGTLDLFTVLFLTRFNHKPLHLFGTIGAVFFALGILINVYLSIEHMMGESIGNRPLLQLGVLLMLMGVQFFSMGLLAEMITLSMARDNNVDQIYEVHLPPESPRERIGVTTSGEAVDK